jgi:thiol-disulfide isomerase/thioredoxin
MGDLSTTMTPMAFFKRRHRAEQLKTLDDFADVLGKGKPVLIDFWKYGCSPCKVMDGIIDEVSEEFQEEAIVIKASLEVVPDLFYKFKIRSTPTFVVLNPSSAGIHQRWRHSGLVKKDVIVDTLSRAVSAI